MVTCRGHPPTACLASQPSPCRRFWSTPLTLQPGPSRANVRVLAVAKAASLSRSATPSKPAELDSAASPAWLPWTRPAPAPEQELQQQGSGFIAPLLRNDASTSAQQPVTSPTGTQLVLPWGRGGSSSTEPAASSAKQPARTGTGTGTASLPYWRLPGTGQQAVAEAPAPLLRPAPIVSCAGGGIFFFWEMGVMKYMMTHFDLSKVELRGASAGGLAITLAECGVNPDKAVAAAFRLAVENNIWDRPGGLAGIWGPLVRQWLDELLPEDAAERCDGRVKLVVTEVPSMRLQIVSNFTSKEDLISANMASVHIPWLLDGKATSTFRGKQYIDGSLYDFFWGSNSEMLTCKGDAFVIDYFNDEELEFSRLDFVKLADFDYIAELERCGYAYAERMDAAGEFDYFLSTVRKGLVRRALEYPVRQISRVFA